MSGIRILTTHAGSLPRPDSLIEANRAFQAGELADKKTYAQQLKSGVIEVVRHQQEAGIDIPNDGEFGKSMGGLRRNFGPWWSYSFQRLGGIVKYEDAPEGYHTPSVSANVQLATFADRRDRALFPEAYSDPDSGVSVFPRGVSTAMMLPVCVEPVTYIGRQAIEEDIANFKTALNAAGLKDGFMTSIAPGSASRIGNACYKTEEEFIYACAEAMREEYKAILDAGLSLQLDDPSIAENWDQINPAPSVKDYQRFSMIRVEALNHALRGFPADRIRFHLCWGSWHGPHVTDIPMKDIVNVMLAVNARDYSFEAGNVRHEHEWKVWQEAKLPKGKRLLPGVVSHATNVVEHEELVADRIERFARLVGPENVVASTDCGLGGRIHPEIAWAKLKALADGAKLAGKRF